MTCNVRYPMGLHIPYQPLRTRRDFGFLSYHYKLSLCARFQLTGSTPAGFQEPFRVVILLYLDGPKYSEMRMQHILYTVSYGVATISRLLRIIGLFCKRALLKKQRSAKETCNFKKPTNRSPPLQNIVEYRALHMWMGVLYGVSYNVLYYISYNVLHLI